MIYLLYGEDSFSLQEALVTLKRKSLSDELADSNTNNLNATHLTFEEFVATCNTVPFLAEKRLVIVQGLLSIFERRQSRKTPRSGTDNFSKLGPWEELSNYLKTLPDSTELIFIDGPLYDSNPLLRILKPTAEAHNFRRPRPSELRPWVKRRADSDGISIEARAIDTLVTTVGSNLGLLVNELEKLSIYRAGEPIRHRDVQDLVAYTKEVYIFDAVDAIIAGKPDLALHLVHQLLWGGNSVQYIFAMLARQVRLLILLKELRSEDVPTRDYGKRLGLTGYPLQKTQDQEPQFTFENLRQIHNILLDADVRMKSTSVDVDLILDVVVSEITTNPNK